MTTPLKALKGSSDPLTMAPLSLSQTDAKKEKACKRFVSPYSISNNQGKNLTGLFALIQAVNDIEGACHMTSEPIICSNGLCSITKPENGNANGWVKKKIRDQLMWLCPQCTLAFSQKQYCQYCKQIYRDTSPTNAIVDGLDWIQCEDCRRWTHIQCEAKNSKADIEMLIHDPKFNYYCAACSKRNIQKTDPPKKKIARKKSEHMHLF
jgi:hypothetical protein